MLAFVIVLQVLVALFLIMVVLLQPGNRGGASAALGGAGSDTVFGGRGANTFLSKITFGAAVCFMVTNLALSFMSSQPQKSVLDSLPAEPAKASETAPAPTDAQAPEAVPAEAAPATPEAASPAPTDAAPAQTAPADASH
jgi:preprotein translocase subunit SecG